MVKHNAKKISRSLTDSEALIEAVEHFRFLPFFRNPVAGWSVEDMTPSELWFTDIPGPWEWKGPVIRTGECLYGKFFDKKAGFVFRDEFPKFAALRRALIPETANPKAAAREAWVLEQLSPGDPVLSLELKELYVEEFGSVSGLETTLTRLQMHCRVVIADFEYKRTKSGKPYGWGLARFTLPEFIAGEAAIEAAREIDLGTAEEEFVGLLCADWPHAQEAVIRAMVTGRAIAQKFR